MSKTRTPSNFVFLLILIKQMLEDEVKRSKKRKKNVLKRNFRALESYKKKYKWWWALSWFVYFAYIFFQCEVWPSERKANIFTFFILNIFFFLHYVKFWAWQECRVVYADQQQNQVNTNFSNNSKDVKQIFKQPYT